MFIFWWQELIYVSICIYGLGIPGKISSYQGSCGNAYREIELWEVILNKQQASEVLQEIKFKSKIYKKTQNVCWHILLQKLMNSNTKVSMIFMKCKSSFVVHSTEND